ncbi:MAG: hypothetical protein AAGD28_11795 [Bacteroidota bacterium]
MKSSSKVLILALIISLFSFSCAEDPLEEIVGISEVNFKESLDTWESLRSAEGDSYYYISRLNRGFGFGVEISTKITVTDGEVVERATNFFSPDSLGQIVLDSSYLETGAELGSNIWGAQVRTMDEIYNTCSETYLFADPNRYEIVFETFENGILKDCGFTYPQCFDECFQGVRLNEFAWL